MFERFSEQARHVVVLAQEEARILKHNYIGTEHLLLGLLRKDEGLAAAVLQAHDLSVESVRAQIEKIVGRGEEVTSGQIPFTPRAKKVLQLSLEEALGLGHNYIGTEHLLLGLARENGGVAVRVLLDFRIDSDHLIDEVRKKVLEAPWTEHGEHPVSVLDRLAGMVEQLRRADRLLHGNDAAAVAYAAGAVNALREAGILSYDEARDWLRRIRAREPVQEASGEFSGRVLERLLPAPEQPADGFRVLGAELYRDGCIIRMQVPPGGTLPTAVELEDSEGTSYGQAEPPNWQGSEGLVGELVAVPAVPNAASELSVRARFKDGTESVTLIVL